MFVILTTLMIYYGKFDLIAIVLLCLQIQELCYTCRIPLQERLISQVLARCDQTNGQIAQVDPCKNVSPRYV